MPARSLEHGKAAGTLFAGIRIRLFGMILLSVLPLIGVIAFDLYQERRRNIDAAPATALDIAHRGAELYNRSIVEARALLEIVAQIPQTAQPGTSCDAILGRIGERRSR